MPALVAVLQSVMAWVIRYGFAKILVALGISIISYGSTMFILNQIKSWVTGSLSGVSSDIYNLMMLSGVGHALGYIFGAYAFVIANGLLNRLTFGKSS